MPELIEVQMYRSQLDPFYGSTVGSIELSNERAIRPKGTPGDILDVLIGTKLASARRHGKLLMLDFVSADGVFVLGVRFGMTGRLLVDGQSAIDQLEYESGKNDPTWDRFKMTLNVDGQTPPIAVALRDQRCLGSVELDPDLSGLAPEASTIGAEVFEQVLAGRTKSVKSALLDQSIIAGLGNLLADEVLWQAGIAPSRPVDELSGSEMGALAQQIRRTVSQLSATGGSHMGDSFEARAAGAACPRCAGRMRSDKIGGRTSWWCTSHQQ